MHPSCAAPIFSKRAEIVKGQTEAPADIQLETTEGDETGPAGIPEFWLNVLRANEVTAQQVNSSFFPTHILSSESCGCNHLREECLSLFLHHSIHGR